jgi:predicted Zn finger-like uncharacterized protein
MSSSGPKEQLRISCPHCHRSYTLRVERERVKSAATTARCGRCGKRFDLPQRLASFAEAAQRAPLRKRITSPAMRRMRTTPPDPPARKGSEIGAEIEHAFALALRERLYAEPPEPQASSPRVERARERPSAPPTASGQAWLDFAGQRLTQLETERSASVEALEWLLVEDQLRD